MHANTHAHSHNFQTDALISWKLFYQLNDDDELQYTRTAHTHTQQAYFVSFIPLRTRNSGST